MSREVSRESGHQLRGGAIARPPDGSRSGLGAIVLGLILGLVTSATSALAAEIVEVRVGKHPEFTRVVFELDRSAGYRIERASPEPGVSELVISLEATSIPRRISSSKSLIEQVEVEPSGPRSIARVRLARSGLKLKEMILASPPRIVLDVISDAPVVPVAKKSPPPTPSAAKPAPAPKPEPQKVVKATPDETREPSPPSEAPARETTTPARSEAVAQAESAADRQRRAVRDTRDEMAEADSAGESRAMALIREREQELAAPGGEPSTSTPLAEAAAEDAAARKAERQAKKAARERERAAQAAAKPSPRPMVAKTPESEGGGWMTWALAAVGGIVLLVGGFLFVRSRAGGEEVDFGEPEASTAGGETDDAPVPFGERAEAASDENPFAGIGAGSDQMTLGAAEGTTAAAGMDQDGETTMVVSQDPHAEDSGAFAFGDTEDTEEKDMDGMDVVSRDAVNEGLGGMPPAMGAIPEEFQQMMREMNRRVESLEGRIDELVDARDRLERQVAAQTEELRVQRAAIARTQRAVRNLARPEDAEQEATEPALRDPSKPSVED
ncbi:MAG: hypothetical protein JRF61_02390 [Deltaproteobacteria bacterium]|jgi:hypothetical protein|nr:hypothetical protein [Deltaproteobacteria bacterium]